MSAKSLEIFSGLGAIATFLAGIASFYKDAPGYARHFATFLFGVFIGAYAVLQYFNSRHSAKNDPDEQKKKLVGKDENWHLVSKHIELDLLDKNGIKAKCTQKVSLTCSSRTNMYHFKVLTYNCSQFYTSLGQISTRHDLGVTIATIVFDKNYKEGDLINFEYSYELIDLFKYNDEWWLYSKILQGGLVSIKVIFPPDRSPKLGEVTISDHSHRYSKGDSKPINHDERNGQTIYSYHTDILKPGENLEFRWNW